MQISDLTSWVSDSQNLGTVITVAAIVIALILGLIIGGGIVSSQSGKQQRTADELAKADVVADVLDCTNEAASWGSLSPAGQAMSDRAIARADVRLRVLPVQGAGAIADWAGHQLAEMKRNSTTGATLQGMVDQFRDRLVLWIYNPKRASKQCQRDLERWAYVAPQAGAAAGRRMGGQDFPLDNQTGGFAPAPVGQGYAQPGVPAPAPAPVPQQVAPMQQAAPAGPAPVPAATSSIPAAAAAHAQAAAALPKDPFEDLLGPNGAR